MSKKSENRLFSFQRAWVSKYVLFQSMKQFFSSFTLGYFLSSERVYGYGRGPCLNHTMQT